MERTLKGLLDYQKFEGNAALQQVIDAVHARYAARELDFSDMERVYAAGVSDIPERNKDGAK